MKLDLIKINAILTIVERVIVMTKELTDEENEQVKKLAPVALGNEEYEYFRSYFSMQTGKKHPLQNSPVITDKEMHTVTDFNDDIMPMAEFIDKLVQEKQQQKEKVFTSEEMCNGYATENIKNPNIEKFVEKTDELPKVTATEVYKKTEKLLPDSDDNNGENAPLDALYNQIPYSVKNYIYKLAKVDKLGINAVLDAVLEKYHIEVSRQLVTNIFQRYIPYGIDTLSDSVLDDLINLHAYVKNGQVYVHDKPLKTYVNNELKNYTEFRGKKYLTKVLVCALAGVDLSKVKVIEHINKDIRDTRLENLEPLTTPRGVTKDARKSNAEIKTIACCYAHNGGDPLKTYIELMDNHNISISLNTMARMRAFQWHEDIIKDYFDKNDVKNWNKKTDKYIKMVEVTDDKVPTKPDKPIAEPEPLPIGRMDAIKALSKNAKRKLPLEDRKFAVKFVIENMKKEDVDNNMLIQITLNKVWDLDISPAIINTVKQEMGLKDAK